MSEQNYDEARERKFQERLARISRRRFVGSAFLLGAGTTLFAPRTATAVSRTVDSATVEEYLTMDIQCECSRSVINNQRISDMFGREAAKGWTFRKVLEEGSKDILQNEAPWKPYGDNLFRALAASNLKLYDLYTEVPDDWDTDKTNRPIKTAAIAAFEYYILPFVALNPEARGKIKRLLNGEMETTPGTYVRIKPFGESFGSQTWTAFTNRRASQSDRWLLALFSRAGKLGMLRLHERWREMMPVVDGSDEDFQATTLDQGKEKCAYTNANGEWRCTDSESHHECRFVGTEPNHEPAAECTICGQE